MASTSNNAGGYLSADDVANLQEALLEKQNECNDAYGALEFKDKQVEAIRDAHAKELDHVQYLSTRVQSLERECEQAYGVIASLQDEAAYANNEFKVARQSVSDDDDDDDDLDGSSEEDEDALKKTCEALKILLVHSEHKVARLEKKYKDLKASHRKLNDHCLHDSLTRLTLNDLRKKQTDDLEKRENDLSLREAELEKRENDLSLREAELETRENDLSLREAELETRAKDLSLREDKVEEGERDIEEMWKVVGELKGQYETVLRHSSPLPRYYYRRRYRGQCSSQYYNHGVRPDNYNSHSDEDDQTDDAFVAENPRRCVRQPRNNDTNGGSESSDESTSVD